MAKRLMNNDVHIFTQVFRINQLMLTIHNSGPFKSETFMYKNIILLILTF